MGLIGTSLGPFWLSMDPFGTSQGCMQMDNTVCTHLRDPSGTALGPFWSPWTRLTPPLGTSLGPFGPRHLNGLQSTMCSLSKCHRSMGPLGCNMGLFGTSLGSFWIPFGTSGPRALFEGPPVRHKASLSPRVAWPNPTGSQSSFPSAAKLEGNTDVEAFQRLEFLAVARALWKRPVCRPRTEATSPFGVSLTRSGNGQ